MSLKQKLKNNELTFGTWVTIGHQSVIEILATAGFDWITLDMEHSVIDLTMAQNLIGHIQAAGIKALVRVGKNEEVIIKRILDAGADGIIVPMVNSREDAEQAVRYAKYPPVGKRGVGLTRAQKYGIGVEEHIKFQRDELVVIAQIEHIDAVRNLEDIISTPGIDGTIVGPYDLSGSMGTPGEYDRPEVKAALQKVEDTCKKANFPLGFHVIQPDHEKLQEKIDLGYNFIAFSLDFFFLGEMARREMGKIKR